LALDQNQGREVALKLFPAGSVTIHAYHEARVLTLITSDHVLSVHNADTYVDVPYLATAIARAGTTEHRVEAAPGLGQPPSKVVRWLRHALVGLEACHGMNLVHRDIKPSNIFLEREDWALLGDLGVAYPMDIAGRVPLGGTLATRAPEMIVTGFGDRTVDIYAVGVSGYRLLTGRWPFAGSTAPDVERSTVDRNLVPLREVAPHVSRRLAARIDAAMAADPRDRFISAMAMHNELGRPGLIRRDWARQSPHPGHVACWRELDPPSREVCVASNGKRFDVETRYGTSGRRIVSYCSTGIRTADLGRRLRYLFDHV
jgi:serine/threonine-protein kinase